MLCHGLTISPVGPQALLHQEGLRHSPHPPRGPPGV